MKIFFTCIAISVLFLDSAMAQSGEVKTKPLKSPKVLYGTASYYADKFEGRETANGEIFSQQKMTAACNVLPLGTWIRVTNLRNDKSAIVKTNDHLHFRMKRVVDLSKAAAVAIGLLDGLAKVKVEVLGRKKPF
jgi:rare lipoprotein A